METANLTSHPRVVLVYRNQAIPLDGMETSERRGTSLFPLLDRNQAIPLDGMETQI